MNLTRLKYGAVLMAVLLLSALPALAATHPMHSAVLHHLTFWAVTLSGAAVFGAVSIQYLWPVNSTVAPTQTVMAQHNLLIAQVFFDTADTIATVTHNMNVTTTTAAGGANTVQGFPLVELTLNTIGTAYPQLSVTAPSAQNTVGINKTNAAGSTCTVTVAVLRPFSPNL
jgi:hypothetical protein